MHICSHFNTRNQDGMKFYWEKHFFVLYLHAIHLIVKNVNDTYSPNYTNSSSKKLLWTWERSNILASVTICIFMQIHILFASMKIQNDQQQSFMIYCAHEKCILATICLNFFYYLKGITESAEILNPLPLSLINKCWKC